jgi:hypothetical protein
VDRRLAREPRAAEAHRDAVRGRVCAQGRQRLDRTRGEAIAIEGDQRCGAGRRPVRDARLDGVAARWSPRAEALVRPYL